MKAENIRDKVAAATECKQIMESQSMAEKHWKTIVRELCNVVEQFGSELLKRGAHD